MIHLKRLWNLEFSNIYCGNNRCISSANASFHADKQHESKLTNSVLQLFFPSLLLAFNLMIMIHPKRLGNLELSNILLMFYEWNEMLMLTL